MAEDSNEFLTSGVRATLPTFEKPVLAEGIARGRQERWAKILPEDRTAKDFEGEIPHGRLLNDVSLATAKSRPQLTTGLRHEMRAYIEGGNMLSGEDQKGQPVILIGRDAVAATMFAYGISEAAVRQLLAEDFGSALRRWEGSVA